MLLLGLLALTDFEKFSKIVWPVLISGIIIPFILLVLAYFFSTAVWLFLSVL